MSDRIDIVETAPDRQARFIMHALLNKPKELKDDHFDFQFENIDYTVSLKESVDNDSNVTSYSIKNTALPGVKSPFFGTNGEIVVKLLGQPDSGKSGYDLTQTQDFLDRGQLMLDAAKRLYKGETKDLDSVWKKFENEINTHCKLDIDKMRQVNGRGEYFDQIYEKSEKIFAFLLLDLSLKLNGGENDKKGIDKAQKEIKKEEIKLISEKGRPVIFKVDYSSDNDNKFFSMQIPLGQKTLPSSDRSGKNQQTKLSNHVRDVTGTVDLKNPLEIKVLQLVDGHSSFSTISEKNNEQRSANTDKAVSEKLLSFVVEALSARDPSDKGDITVSWSTMMLLSPLLNASVEKFARGAESEHGQLSESQDALKKISGKRIPIDQLIKSVYGEKVPKELQDYKDLHVNVNVDYMNTAVNAMAGISGITGLYKDINQKGFSKFRKNIVSFIEKNINEIKLPNDLNHIIKDIIKTKGGMQENDAKNMTEKLNVMLNREDCADNKELILLGKRFVEACQEFANSSNNKNPYLFITRYVQCNRAIGHFVDMFCKSAEDRTGWARVRLAADEMYFSTHKRDPDFTKEADVKEYDRLVLKAVELSASIENTKYNSEARGLQVSGKHVHSDVSIINKKMGVIAKKPYHNIETYFAEWQQNRGLQKGATDKPNLKRRFNAAVDYISESAKRSKSSSSLVDNTTQFQSRISLRGSRIDDDSFESSIDSMRSDDSSVAMDAPKSAVSKGAVSVQPGAKAEPEVTSLLGRAGALLSGVARYSWISVVMQLAQRAWQGITGGAGKDSVAASVEQKAADKVDVAGLAPQASRDDVKESAGPSTAEGLGKALYNEVRFVGQAGVLTEGLHVEELKSFLSKINDTPTQSKAAGVTQAIRFKGGQSIAVEGGDLVLRGFTPAVYEAFKDEAFSRADKPTFQVSAADGASLRDIAVAIDGDFHKPNWRSRLISVRLFLQDTWSKATGMLLGKAAPAFSTSRSTTEPVVAGTVADAKAADSIAQSVVVAADQKSMADPTPVQPFVDAQPVAPAPGVIESALEVKQTASDPDPSAQTTSAEKADPAPSASEQPAVSIPSAPAGALPGWLRLKVTVGVDQDFKALKGALDHYAQNQNLPPLRYVDKGADHFSAILSDGQGGRLSIQAQQGKLEVVVEEVKAGKNTTKEMVDIVTALPKSGEAKTVVPSGPLGRQELIAKPLQAAGHSIEKSLMAKLKDMPPSRNTMSG